MIPDLILRIRFAEPGDPAPVVIEALRDAISFVSRNRSETHPEFPLHDRAGIRIGTARWDAAKQ